MKAFWILALVGVAVAGCGAYSEPRLDATSTETAQASLKKMLDRIQDEQKADKFRAAVLLLRERLMLRENVTKEQCLDAETPERINYLLRNEMGGLTADEIIRKANATREEEARVLEADRQLRACVHEAAEKAGQKLLLTMERLKLIDKRNVAKTKEQAAKLDAEVARIEEELAQVEKELGPIREQLALAGIYRSPFLP